jgi:hypothetical protein
MFSDKDKHIVFYTTVKDFLQSACSSSGMVINSAFAGFSYKCNVNNININISTSRSITYPVQCYVKFFVSTTSDVCRVVKQLCLLQLLG